MALVKRSIPFAETRVQVSNETTLAASLRLVKRGLGPLALNFAKGIHSGFLIKQGAASERSTASVLNR